MTFNSMITITQGNMILGFRLLDFCYKMSDNVISMSSKQLGNSRT